MLIFVTVVNKLTVDLIICLAACLHFSTKPGSELFSGGGSPNCFPISSVKASSSESIFDSVKAESDIILNVKNQSHDTVMIYSDYLEIYLGSSVQEFDKLHV